MSRRLSKRTTPEGFDTVNDPLILKGSRNKIEDNLEPPVRLIVDLDRSTAQGPFCSQQNGESGLVSGFFTRHLKSRLLKVTRGIVDAAAVLPERVVYGPLRQGACTEQGSRVMPGVVKVAERPGRRFTIYGVVRELQHGRKEAADGLASDLWGAFQVSGFAILA